MRWYDIMHRTLNAWIDTIGYTGSNIQLSTILFYYLKFIAISLKNLWIKFSSKQNFRWNVDLGLRMFPCNMAKCQKHTEI